MYLVSPRCDTNIEISKQFWYYEDSMIAKTGYWSIIRFRSHLSEMIAIILKKDSLISEDWKDWKMLHEMRVKRKMIIEVTTMWR